MIDLDTEKLKLKLDIERIGNTLGLDEFRIKESKENGASTMISSNFIIRVYTGYETRTAVVLKTWL